MRVLNKSILDEAYGVNKEVTRLEIALQNARFNEAYNIERANTYVRRANKWFGYILTNDNGRSFESFADSGMRCIEEAKAHRLAALECYAEIRTLENRIDTITGNVLYFVTDAEEEEWAKLN